MTVMTVRAPTIGGRGVGDIRPPPPSSGVLGPNTDIRRSPLLGGVPLIAGVIATVMRVVRVPDDWVVGVESVGRWEGGVVTIMRITPEGRMDG